MKYRMKKAISLILCISLLIPTIILEASASELVRYGSTYTKIQETIHDGVMTKTQNIESSGSNEPESGSGESGTSESGTGESTTNESGTGESTTNESGTGESTTSESGTGESTTNESGTGESTTSESGTGESTTNESGTEESTTNESETEKKKIEISFDSGEFKLRSVLKYKAVCTVDQAIITDAYLAKTEDGEHWLDADIKDGEIEIELTKYTSDAMNLYVRAAVNGEETAITESVIAFGENELQKLYAKTEIQNSYAGSKKTKDFIRGELFVLETKVEFEGNHIPESFGIRYTCMYDNKVYDLGTENYSKKDLIKSSAVKYTIPPEKTGAFVQGEVCRIRADIVCEGYETDSPVQDGNDESYPYQVSFLHKDYKFKHNPKENLFDQGIYCGDTYQVLLGTKDEIKVINSKEKRKLEILFGVEHSDELVINKITVEKFGDDSKSVDINNGELSFIEEGDYSVTILVEDKQKKNDENYEYASKSYTYSMKVSFFDYGDGMLCMNNAFVYTEHNAENTYIAKENVNMSAKTFLFWGGVKWKCDNMNDCLIEQGNQNYNEYAEREIPVENLKDGKYVIHYMYFPVFSKGLYSPDRTLTLIVDKQVGGIKDGVLIEPTAKLLDDVDIEENGRKYILANKEKKEISFLISGVDDENLPIHSVELVYQESEDGKTFGDKKRINCKRVENGYVASLEPGVYKDIKCEISDEVSGNEFNKTSIDVLSGEICFDNEPLKVTYSVLDSQEKDQKQDTAWTNKNVTYKIEVTGRPYVDKYILADEISFEGINNGSDKFYELYEVLNSDDSEKNEIKSKFGDDLMTCYLICKVNEANQIDNYIIHKGTISVPVKLSVSGCEKENVTAQMNVAQWFQKLQKPDIWLSDQELMEQDKWYNIQAVDKNIHIDTTKRNYVDTLDKPKQKIEGLILICDTKAELEEKKNSSDMSGWEAFEQIELSGKKDEEAGDSKEYYKVINLNDNKLSGKEGYVAVKIRYVDEAGNESDYSPILTFKLDTKAPSIEQVTGTIGENRVTLEADNGLEERYALITNQDVTLSADIKDKYINPNCMITCGLDSNLGLASLTLKSEKLKRDISWWQALNDLKESNGDDYVEGGKLTVDKLYTAGTKGMVYVQAIDAANNKKIERYQGVIIDNKAPTARIELKGLVEEKYCTGTKPVVNLTINDDDESYSGIGSIGLVYTNQTTGIQENLDNIPCEQIENVAIPTKEQIDKSKSINVDVAIPEDEGEIILKAIASDRAGNPCESQEVKIVVDRTKPEIEIGYDSKNEAEVLSGEYMGKDSVTANVKLTEANFTKQDFELVVTRDGVDYPVNGKLDGTAPIYTGKFVFSEDGAYTVTAKCKDDAGLEAEYDRVDKFVIDKTSPVIKVTYDNNDVYNEKYYNKPRKATITVEEKNFDPDLMEIQVGYSGFNGLVTNTSTITDGWSSSGDRNTLVIPFEWDGHYTLAIKGKDLAGNEAEAFATQDFYIDTELPVVEIQGVEDNSANASDVFPLVLVKDDNYSIKDSKIQIIDGLYKKAVIQPVVGRDANGYSYDFSAINSQKDGVYELVVRVVDLAGNEIEENLRFSLNRNGSTYDLSDFADIIEKHYINYKDMRDVTVSEMNVDTIEKFSIYMSRNGDMLMNSLKTKRPSTNYDASNVYYGATVNGNELSGYEYKYLLYKENFSTEGTYNLTFYSKDRAGNEVNNTSDNKNADILFVIDNTAPEVSMSGAVAGEYFDANDQTVNISVKDNFKLQDASIYVVDEAGQILDEYQYLDMVQEEGDKVSLKMSYPEKQVAIAYRVCDAAGNANQTIADEQTVKSDNPNSDNESITESETDTEKQKSSEAVEEDSNWIIILSAVLGAVLILGTIVYVTKRKKN